MKILGVKHGLVERGVGDTLKRPPTTTVQLHNATLMTPPQHIENWF